MQLVQRLGEAKVGRPPACTFPELQHACAPSPMSDGPKICRYRRSLERNVWTQCHVVHTVPRLQ